MLTNNSIDRRFKERPQVVASRDALMNQNHFGYGESQMFSLF